MDIGIGSPITIPGTTGELALEWARRADRGPFSSLSTLVRIVFPNYDPLIALAASAAVTTRTSPASLNWGALYSLAVNA